MDNRIEIEKNNFDQLVIDLLKFYDEAYTDGYHGVKDINIINTNEFVENHFIQISDLYPFHIEGIGMCYKRGQLNHFGGLDIPYQQVLKSPAGYYIGTLYFDIEIGDGEWMPNSRDSEKYYDDRKSAEFAFKSMIFLPKTNP